MRDAIIGQLGGYRYFCGSELDDRFVSGLDEAKNSENETNGFAAWVASH